MATIIVPNLLTEATVVNGLNTYEFTVVTAGQYLARIDVTQPSSSGMLIEIEQNSSVIASLQLPVGAAVTQGAVSLQGVMNCSTNDVIKYILSSSNANDEQLNAIKAQLVLKQSCMN